jgi:hypothetical protein
MSIDKDVTAIADDEFDAWANRRHLSLFERAPYRRCWQTAYRAGYELAMPPAQDDVDADDSIDPVGPPTINA